MEPYYEIQRSTALKYNLLDEKWIWVTTSDLQLKKVSLLEILNDAHSLKELSNDSPMADAAIMRMLLAICFAAFSPKGKADVKKILNKGKFGKKVSDYLESYTEEKFDVLGEKPFLQSDLKTVKKLCNKTIPIHRMIMADGNNPSHFTKFSDSDPEAVDLDEAVRLMLAYQFSTHCGLGEALKNEGLKSKFSYKHGAARTLGGIFIFIRGKNLFETLCYNLSSAFSIPSDKKDSCAWDKDLTKKLPETPDGFCDLMTWTARLMRLVVEDGKVSQVYVAPCRTLDEEAVKDPFCAYRRDKKNRMRPWNTFGKRAWRSFNSLFLNREMDRNSNNIKIPESFGIVPKWTDEPFVVLDIYIINTDRAKTLDWRRESYSMPTQCLDNMEYSDLVNKMVEIASMASNAFFSLVKLPVFDNKPTEKDKADAVRAYINNHVDPYYWPELENQFRKILTRVPDIDEAGAQGLKNEWRDIVKAQAQSAFYKIIESSVARGQTLNAIVGENSVLRIFEAKIRKVTSHE